MPGKPNFKAAKIVGKDVQVTGLSDENDF